VGRRCVAQVWPRGGRERVPVGFAREVSWQVLEADRRKQGRGAADDINTGGEAIQSATLQK